ncbi:ABC transporter permease [Paenibacillus azoreducens]|uniref:ABC3 transporter permease C-terminal domain-containing protein n=1 Tax=Paenibacillus azoreducens TaxID=116718 RepID=A0A920CQN1_9BACL|nr:FtsX-like permease family protein [Paenibacillus azoreducens]GIO46209.1 hypothetical protein J34TS1_09740 [Paenibacillus azoreducens]
MNLFNLAMANIKKAKGAAASLFTLILAAVLLLNVGITIISSMGGFYGQKVKELHGAHVNIAMTRASLKQSYVDFIQNYDGVQQAETEQIILMPRTAVRFDKKVKNDFSLRTALLNADSPRSIAPLKLIRESASYEKGGIYVPYSLHASGGYQIGDSFSLTYKNKHYDYRIAGFFESTMMGKPNLAMIAFYLPDSSFRQLQIELGPEADGILISAVFADNKHPDTLLRDYHKQFPESNESIDPGFWSADIAQAQHSTLTIHIVAMILVAFAAVIVLVSMIVIKFRISGSIEDGMVNIGVLQAVGYTSSQILISIVLQFMLIAAAASIMGVAISYAVIPAFGGIITKLTGLLWPGGAHIGSDTSSAFVILFLVLIVSLLSSVRIRSLHPVAALRGGMNNHNFKRNHFPLDKTKGGLQFVLACKNIAVGLRQNLMIAAIVAAIAFAAVFSVILYYNIADDKTPFLRMIGTETPNVGIEVQPGQDSGQLLMQLKRMPGVKKAIILDYITTSIEGRLVMTDFSDDYGQVDNPTVYQGRYPKYDNEIVISGGLARSLGKNIGDTIQVHLGKSTEPYLITGLNQSLNSWSNGASLTIAGVQRLAPGHQGMSINVYLDGIENEFFMSGVKAKYGSMIQSATNTDQLTKNQTRVYISAVFSVMVAILTITVLVVVLILYLVITAALLKRKRELGILKAIGYTTFQLRSQIALSFVPVVIVGVLIGGVLGGICTNSILKMLLSGAGIYNVQLIIPVPLILLLSLSIILLAYFASMMVSGRIKRIAAYGLISE